MGTYWPKLWCRYCGDGGKDVKQCSHRIAHAQDMAPCGCPSEYDIGGVSWIPVYMAPPGKVKFKVYECCECAEIWIVEDNHHVTKNPSPLQIEEAILGKFDDRKTRMLHLRNHLH